MVRILWNLQTPSFLSSILGQPRRCILEPDPGALSFWQGLVLFTSSPCHCSSPDRGGSTQAAPATQHRDSFLHVQLTPHQWRQTLHLGKQRETLPAFSALYWLNHRSTVGTMPGSSFLKTGLCCRLGGDGSTNSNSSGTALSILPAQAISQRPTEPTRNHITVSHTERCPTHYTQTAGAPAQEIDLLSTRVSSFIKLLLH